MSKGSKRRPPAVKRETYEDRWARVFGARQEQVSGWPGDKTQCEDPPEPFGDGVFLHRDKEKPE